MSDPGDEQPGDDPARDELPAGDPRDPRFDASAVRRSRRRLLPRWAMLVTVGLVAAMSINLVRFGAGLGRVVEALVFAAVVCAPIVIGLAILERRAR